MAERTTPQPDNWPWGALETGKGHPIGTIEYEPCSGSDETYSCYELGGEYHCPGCTQRLEWPMPTRMTHMNLSNIRANLQHPSRDRNYFEDGAWATYQVVCTALTVAAVQKALADNKKALSSVMNVLETRI